MKPWFENKDKNYKIVSRKAEPDKYAPNQIKPKKFKEYNKNKSLFWYGFFGDLKVFFGIILIVFSGVISLFLSFKNPKLFHLFWIGLGVGIYFICKGKSQRFDYKMQSGSIIHKGDWN